MIIIPPDLLTRFESILTQRSVPCPLRNYYKKWLRFYLDFFRKYNHLTATDESLRDFIKKLQEKNQTPEQQKQASRAISLCIGLVGKEEEEIESHVASEESEKKIPLQQIPPDSRDIPTSAVAEWKNVHDELCAEIRIRHYSPKTLKLMRY